MESICSLLSMPTAFGEPEFIGKFMKVNHHSIFKRGGCHTLPPVDLRAVCFVRAILRSFSTVCSSLRQLICLFGLVQLML